MKNLNLFFLYSLVLLIYSCSTGKKSYSPENKYAKQTLQSDFILLRNILEEKHPSLYWYTSKDSMDGLFTGYYEQIKDSMTEREFAWHIIAPVLSRIRCGHTSMSMSKSHRRRERNNRPPIFPLLLRIWKDTVVVTGNLILKDSSVKRGDIITHINGIKTDSLIPFMFDHLSQDGYADNLNYFKLSAGFSYYHRSIFGTNKEYKVGYKDTKGNIKQAIIPASIRSKDSIKKARPTQLSFSAPLSLTIDSAGKCAIMKVDNFTKWNIRHFFKRSFVSLRKKNISNLILDLRLNGGGRINASTLLTKYISRRSFKVADSVYSLTNHISPYSRYINGGIFNTLQMKLTTKKLSDGNYHYGEIEKKTHSIKNKNHYNGNVYVLLSGPSFSATCLLAAAIKGQPGITLLGEETGGSSYGNNGILIPDIILPQTKIRVRLPLFRLIQSNRPALKGRGIFPDIEIKTDYESLMKGIDRKMSVAKELIYNDIRKSSPTE